MTEIAQVAMEAQEQRGGAHLISAESPGEASLRM